MKDRDLTKIFPEYPCVINWNLPSPNAGAAAYALQLQEGVSKDLVQDAHPKKLPLLPGSMMGACTHIH